MNDDLISRQALKDNINSWYELLAEFNQPYMTLSHDDIIQKIDSMPSVQPIDHKQEEINFDLLAENETLESEVEKYKKAIEDIKLDIMRYESDCLLLEDRPICKECNDTMFGSIYHIIDKHISGKENNG